ncbi:DNA phosphorothioation-dependent restriction protein DptG [Methanosphaera sp. ISO3-F5]|uniref:DNA phosphorothioation-dependent restriction protein DptG n=1 Tax=Methanosphaera sp. ISO3-F5 TaxID=1452353 RepID=UPI002B25B2CC|nr:DNA phosphorothioation-dependent restriction protein DptG [Methanosphaera sp. ISO3-F5]WQH63908.1 DNA phosphorothioation-dependent restriction protein DptG [Methanosphaera sp. ISO3-F5]
MDYNENLNILLSEVITSNHKFERKMEQIYLPIITNQNSKFENGFKTIVANSVRIFNHKKITEEYSNEKLIHKIINNDNFSYDKNDKKYLEALIKSFLINENNELNIIHPYFYMYVPEVTNKQRSNELQIGQFISDLFYSDVEGIGDYFDFKDDDKTELYYKNNILTDLVFKNLIVLPENTSSSNYVLKLNYVKKVFKEDIEFVIENNEEFLTSNLEELLAYYYFYYITQLTFKLYNKNNNLNKIEPLYYLTSNENISSNRKTINSGYSLIKNNNFYDIVTKILVISYLNKLLGTKGLVYSEIIEKIENMSNEEYNDFIYVLKEFIKIYVDLNPRLNLNEDFLNENNYIQIIDYMFECFNDPFYNAANNRYFKAIENLGKLYFLKRKGRYGYVLNISDNLLLAITALCIKEEKIKLKQLFKEYELRGLFFDKKSKKEIENLLTKLNLIDKKSDSGDAQYVRRIL